MAPGKSTLLVIAAMITACLAARAPAAEPPEVSLLAGRALVRLARSAMSRYLTHRTPADRQRIPPELKALSQRRWAAAVRLRKGGRPVGKSIQAGRSLPRNVIAAAMKAMRSPKLPRRLGQKDLEALRVEVEVIGPAQAVTERQLPRALVPGMTGLMLIRAGSKAYVLPSVAYLAGLGGQEIRGRCLVQIPLTAATTRAVLTWKVFATRHYVGYPDGRVVWLVRGRIPLPDEAISEQTLLAACDQVGRCLMRHQSSLGLYRPGSTKPTLPEHLYATYAMARLAAATRQKDIAASVNAAAGYAIQFLRQRSRRAHVTTRDPEDQLAATSLLLLTTRQLPPNPAGEALKRKLAAAIVADLTRASNRPAQAEPTHRNGRRREGIRLALLALDGAAAAGNASARKVASLRRKLRWAAPQDPRRHLARLAGHLPQAHRSSQPAAGGSARPIRRPATLGLGGGLAAGRKTAAASLTASSAIHIAAKLPSARLTAVRRFCHQMMYKGREAYFAADPGDWIGAVRARPGSAEVTLEACAVAIEMLLAGRAAEPAATRPKAATPQS